MQRIEIDFTLYQQNEVRERKYEKLTTTDVLHSHYLESTINLRGFFLPRIKVTIQMMNCRKLSSESVQCHFIHQ